MTAAEVAESLLADLLMNGPRPAADILIAATRAGISERSLQRASITLGVRKERPTFRGGWIWHLPNDESTEAPSNCAALPPYGAEPGLLNHDKVSVRVEANARAEVIATRLRKLEGRRGYGRAPFYAADPRVIAWVELGISDPDLREAYDRARTDHTCMLTAGILNRYINEVTAETMA